MHFPFVDFNLYIFIVISHNHEHNSFSEAFSFITEPEGGLGDFQHISF